MQVLIIQLPIPQNSFGRQTGNIPLAGACLCQAADGLHSVDIRIMPERVASYSGDAAILEWVCEQRPDIIGFSAYAWNIQRVRYLARRCKEIYSPVIVVGGPEITPDNPLANDSHFDHRIEGPGEAPFVQLLQKIAKEDDPTRTRSLRFAQSASPYLTTPLEHNIEQMMLLETTRGCPYRCAFCFYNKSSRRLAFKDDRRVLEAVSWAFDQDLAEIYFLDPSLNARPGLKRLLKEIALRNPDRRMALTSEIRAEAVDAELAELLAAAGFKNLEIGLQTTNPEALWLMRRPTDLDRFSAGVRLLKQHGIKPSVDLIVGLPGDHPEGFGQTLRFVHDRDFYDDIQVFPLALLPGTEFRRRHRSLGLEYDPEPPYLVTRTPGFGPHQILDSLVEAESAFDVSLYPKPDLDLSWRLPGCTTIADARDIMVDLDGRACCYKVVLQPHRPWKELQAAARRLTAPYQILVPPALTKANELIDAISLFSGANPHTPFEVIFFDPKTPPDVETLLRGARLQRPHYLDNQLRFAQSEAGNRAILFTLVGTRPRPLEDAALRAIFWWRSEDLPDTEDLRTVAHDGFEGVLLDSRTGMAPQQRWQERMAPAAGDLPLMTFALPALQRRWITLTARDRYYPPVLPG